MPNDVTAAKKAHFHRGTHHAPHYPLIEAASQAPSGHNTQPWRFQLEDARITIHPDFSKRLPAVDPDDRDALRFILGHELGHIRLKHVMWWYNLLTFVGNLPGLNYLIGQPLSRAREYGCDKIGYALTGDRACKGLLLLAAGKHLYRQVDIDAYEKDQIAGGQKWAAVHNFFIDHPVISWRIAAIRQNRHGDLFIAKKAR